MRKLIHNASLLNSQGKEVRGGLLIENGKVLDIGEQVKEASQVQESINAQGALLVAGLIDMKAFIGEPGLEYRETLASAAKSAAKGGITHIICQPQTEPALDDPALIDFIKRRAASTACVHISPMGAITKGCKGLELAEIGLLQQAGALAFSDGDHAIQNALVMRRALTYARDFDALIVHHIEEEALKAEGVMNEGELATRRGLSGIPHEAETIMLVRDLQLAALTGARYHVANLSSRYSLPLLQAAKEQGVKVTASVSINNLSFNENDVGGYRTFFKVSPPLRAEEDRQALIEGLSSGLIDVIVSDHNPQDVESKRLPFSEAGYGAVGLETLLPAALRLYHNGHLSLQRLLNALSHTPAKLLGLEPLLQKGSSADFTLIDLNAPWRLNRETLLSKCKNSPFDEAKFSGQVLSTYVAGQKVWG